MKYIQKIIELVANLGTPSFHNLLGNLIVSETHSSKMIIVRFFENLWVVLDAKNVFPSKLEYQNIEDIIREAGLEKIYDFPFDTYVLCDGKFEDEETSRMIVQAFEKEKELFENQRLLTVIDRLSYQLSSIESLVLNLSEPLSIEKFMEIVASGISELLFCSVSIYRVNERKALKTEEYGRLKLNIDEFELSEELMHSIEISSPIIINRYNKFQDKAFDKIKAVIPVGTFENDTFLLFITRDTSIEEEEKLFINTIYRIIFHFYTKQFLEILDFKEEIAAKTLNILKVFDNIIYMIKGKDNIEERFFQSIGSMTFVEQSQVFSPQKALADGVYSSRECSGTEYDLVVSYTSPQGIKKSIGITVKKSFKNSILEIINIVSLVLDGYETIIEN